MRSNEFMKNDVLNSKQCKNKIVINSDHFSCVIYNTTGLCMITPFYGKLIPSTDLLWNLESPLITSANVF